VDVTNSRLDWSRIAVSTALAAGLGVGMGAAFLYRSGHTPHIGPTSAALSDAFSWIAGACLGLALGSFVAAVLVRHGSRLGSGMVAGVLGFFVGVVPYLLLKAPSDTSTGDDIVFLVFVFIPVLLLVVLGAGLGDFAGRQWENRRAT
jgi:hypothetical protein